MSVAAMAMPKKWRRRKRRPSQSTSTCRRRRSSSAATSTTASCPTFSPVGRVDRFHDFSRHEPLRPGVLSGRERRRGDRRRRGPCAPEAALRERHPLAPSRRCACMFSCVERRREWRGGQAEQRQVRALVGRLAVAAYRRRDVRRRRHAGAGAQPPLLAAGQRPRGDLYTMCTLNA